MPGKEETSKESYYGDLSKTNKLSELFEVPIEQRDQNWQSKFLENVGEASFACGTPQVIEGPDGFPYFQLNIPEPYKEFECFVLMHMKDFLLQHGIGVVINANKGQPDWVFSHGDIVNFQLRAEFYTESEKHDLPSQEVIKDGEEILVGQPAEAILPIETRAVIREFLTNAGLENVKIALVNRRRPSGILQELVFNLTPARFQSTEHYEAVMRSIAWYLPRHYSYVSMEESALGENFQPL